MGSPVGRKPWSTEAGRIITPIALYPILREYIDTIGEEYTDHITELLIGDLERFIGTNHNGQEPNYHGLKEKAKVDLIKIKEFRSKIKMEKEARYLKNPPTGDEETEALNKYLKSLLPFQKTKLRWISQNMRLDELLPYQEACEKKTGVWVRPVIFTRKFPPLEVPKERSRLPLCDACIRAHLPCPVRDADIMIEIQICPHFVDRESLEIAVADVLMERAMKG